MSLTFFGLDIETAATMFFDRKAVTDAIGKEAAQGLGRFGAHVRQRAKTSIRYRKHGVSQPGEPPYAHSHDSTLSLRNILFAFDPGEMKVIIGPVRVDVPKALFFLATDIPLPGLIEYGGTAQIADQPRSSRQGRRRTARYRARPYMRPAFNAEIASNLPAIFAG